MLIWSYKPHVISFAFWVQTIEILDFLEISFCINSPSVPRTEANVIIHCMLFEISMYFLVKMITLKGKPYMEHSIWYVRQTHSIKKVTKDNHHHLGQFAIWALLAVLPLAPDPGNFLPVAPFWVLSSTQTHLKILLVIYDKFLT